MKRKARLVSSVEEANAWLETNSDISVIDIQVATSVSMSGVHGDFGSYKTSTVISIIYEAKE